MVVEGKRIVLNTSFVCSIISWACVLISFSSPYWFQSWPRVHSPFKRIGLWEACFAGLILPMDPKQKAYHGCWWTLAKEYIPIREWLMPWWFIITQVIATVCLVAETINCIILLYIWCVTDPNSDRKQRPPIRFAQISSVIILVSAVLKSGAVILFGVAVHNDRYWMPYPELNYLSWSYGLFIVSAFFCIFGSFASIPYCTIARDELFEPPPPARGGPMGLPPKYGIGSGSNMGESHI